MTGSQVTKYYCAGAQRVAMRTSGTLYYLLGDHLGSTSLVTFANGNAFPETRYKPWGETRYTSGSTPTKYTFTGQYSNMDDFSLMFYNARWYDPALGRFAQADTIVPGGVQGYDRYAYTNNNPLLYTDPTGHCTLGGHQMDDSSSACQWASTPSNQGSLSGNGNGGFVTPNPKPKPPKGDDKDKKLWQDNWFEVSCAYVSSCAGQFVKYYTFSFGTAIPNPITGTVVGWHGAVTLDQYGDWFFGLGLDAGKNVFGVSASLVEGRFARDQLPKNNAEERNFLKSFLTGNSFQGFIVPIVYVGANYSPSVNTTTLEDGAGSPQGGAAWTYTGQIKGANP